MIKFKGLRSVFVPAALIASVFVFFPAGEPSAFVVDTSSVLLQQPESTGQTYKPEAERLFAFAVKMKGLGNTAEARRSLGEVRSLYPGTPWEKRADLLLGLISLEEGRAEASVLIEEAAGLEAIDDYILFFQAEALVKSGRFIEAAGTYGFIISSYPSSALRERAAFRKASALFNAGSLEEASKAFRQFISGWPKSSLIPEANLKLAKSLMGQGLEEEALSPLKEVSTGYPLSQSAHESDKLLSRLDFGADNTGAFSPGERFRRSENFFVSASYDKALSGYATLLKDGAFRDRALFRTAVANIRLKRYKEGEKALREYLSLKEPSKKAEALYYLALVSMRQGREEGVFESEKQLSKSYPRSDERAKALLLIAKLKSGKDPEGAALAYRAVLEEFAGSAVSEEAFWSIGWEAYTSGRLIDAYDDFSMYLESRPKGRLSGQFLYWKARTAERLGRSEEAGVLFERVCSSAPQSFYCLMAEVRRPGQGQGVQAAAGAPFEVQAVSAVMPPELKQELPAASAEMTFRRSPRYQAAEELLLLGLSEQASTEIDLLARNHSEDKAALVELANLLYDASDFYRAFRIYRVHLSGSNEKEHLPLGYPMRLVESVKEKAPSEAADPYLVAAVMREESHFNPGAVSPVGALGLMQIMPSTGKQIAKELGEGFRKGSLLDPGTSIRFGSWYLGQILKRFNGDAVLAIAGYNAGPNAAARWAAALPGETDEFVESIPYEETRGYVKRVLRSYAEFLKLGKEKFEGRVVRPSPAEPLNTKNEADASGGAAF
ncbi:soluble lytic murein transglycosylase [uncultured bacterium]|nr:soluble lytic murein transglycosylase [uncultured bacterium]